MSKEYLARKPLPTDAAFQTPTPLERAIRDEETRVGQAIDLLRDIADDAEEDEIDDHYDALNQLATDLRMTHALLGCLRRLTRGRTVRDLHDAFGAPGDFGYETPIGDALARAYGLRGEETER